MVRKKTLLLIFFVSFLLSYAHIFAFETLPDQNKAKVLYTKYKNYPSVVFSKQRFTLSVELSIFLPDEVFFKIATNIVSGKNITMMQEDIVWYLNSENRYETTLLFKAHDENFLFPAIEIMLMGRDGNIIDSEILKAPKIEFRKIAINQERYSNIIANNIEVTSAKSRQYSNEEIMVLLEIEGEKSNLEEFFLSKYENQGIKDIVNLENKQKIFYFVMVPIFEKEIVFEYYNPIDSRFVPITIPIEIKEELVSTQSDLNPYENDLGFYKRIGIIIVILIFLMFYLFRSKKLYLIVALILMIYIVTISLPNEKIVLKANEKVYILPTHNSTIFKILKNQEEVEILGYNDTKEYIKVVFKNNQIGWIKNDRKN